MNRVDRRLDILLSEIRACRKCADDPDGKPLPHEPRPVLRVAAAARICICGQAPGTRVHASGMPFTDPSGERLRQWMGVTEEEFYDASRIAIVPMGFCFPGLDSKGSDLPPRRECARLWRERLFAMLPSIELLMLVGKYAQDWHLREAGVKPAASMTGTVADWRSSYGRHRPRILPLPHPSWRNNTWLKKNPWFESDLLPVLRKEVRRLIGAGMSPRGGARSGA